jgi:CHAT domain-containing protein
MEAKSHVAAEEAVLIFLAGPERLDLFVVRSGGVFHESAAVGARDLATRVRVAREQLIGRPEAAASAGLGALHTLLLGPAADRGAFRGAARLLIVPHGSLAALPFAALWDQQAGRYLVEDYLVSYLPAAAALVERQPGSEAATGRVTVFAPLPDSLPGSAREARAIARLVPGTRTRLGRASTEAGVRRTLEAGGSVHLASHGSQNSQNPLFSRMIAGRRSGPGSVDDGRLEVNEILGMRTTSPLVFLSGCESGLASAGLEPFSAGTEEGSLAQAFLVAGAGTVVATLWRVSDAGAANLAERFYRHFEGGSSAAEALAVSQREEIRARRGADWAAYAVWGTGGRKSEVVVRTTEVRH